MIMLILVQHSFVWGPHSGDENQLQKWYIIMEDTDIIQLTFILLYNRPSNIASRTKLNYNQYLDYNLKSSWFLM